ncbi:MAG: type IV pilus twitching motility protein PilT [Candidatus Acididesulfobacter guangdongensis]|uniref:Type IV pilus twitching motility protein PilT n=1 Tax=Acididesulfobacter guangdongensis TaxID=2597225 RepID=A0A519BHI3_ACIG2|nr:MAG: type IV pilus twitching motility protein PilT [Candidatus Acididesulfobacter guangdongensis]
METDNINNITDINNTNHISNTNNTDDINGAQRNIALEQQKQSLTFIEKILTFSVNKKASDVHLKVNSAPIFRINGELVVQPDFGVLSKEIIDKIAFSMIDKYQMKVFQENKDVDLAYSLADVGRFRVNIFSQRNSLSIAMRYIPFSVPSIDTLSLPPIVKSVALKERGLILVTGITGSGKSTTLASMINYINANKSVHIITIEDPIEYLHKDIKSIVNQREIGMDVYSFSHGLREALRQDPDVVLVGEMRDLETIETAITAAETGHLVMSTLHTLDAQETINRIIAVFPPYQQKQIRIQLSSVITAVISQRLIQKADKQGRLPAAEILIGTETIKDCILNEDKTSGIRDYIKAGNTQYGMQTFDQSLYGFYKNNLITYEDALAESTSPNDLALLISGVDSASGSGSSNQSIWETK